MSRSRHLSLFALLALCSSVILPACGGPRAVRGEDVAGLDDEAYSTGLDKRDLDKMLRENLTELQKSDVVARWEKEDRPAVAVVPMRNETSEHVDSALQALISDVETALRKGGHLRVLSLEQQPRLMDEIKRQYQDGFDPSQVARWGKQIGARYVVTGKVFTTDERQRKERRVQYYMFMQVLDIETGEILFQNKTSLTKAII